MRTELSLAKQQTDNAAQQYRATVEDLTHTRSLLREAQRQAERADAEVQVTRRLFDNREKRPARRTAPAQPAG